MAIQIDLNQSQFGVPFQGAYFRVAAAAFLRSRAPEPHRVMIDVMGYATRPEGEDTREVDQRRYHAPASEIFSQPGDDFVAQCYSWLMTQSDMLGSVAL